jgi:hypothetical protein
MNKTLVRISLLGLVLGAGVVAGGCYGSTSGSLYLEDGYYGGYYDDGYYYRYGTGYVYPRYYDAYRYPYRVVTPRPNVYVRGTYYRDGRYYKGYSDRGRYYRPYRYAPPSRHYRYHAPKYRSNVRVPARRGYR